MNLNIEKYWYFALKQQAKDLREFFSKEAYINWHNTNEHFTVDEFIIANCEYPGEWNGIIERIIEKDDLIITAVKVNSIDKKLSFHVTSFFKIKDGKIISIDEYWGDDGNPPQWRIDKCIGISIK